MSFDDNLPTSSQLDDRLRSREPQHASTTEISDRNSRSSEDTFVRVSSTFAQPAMDQNDGAGSASSSQYLQTRQPINDAVTSAFDRTNNHLPQDILNQITSQITASVLQNLRAANLGPAAVPTTLDSTNPRDSTISSQSSTGSDPLIDRSKVYTPPSPYRASEEAAQTQTSPSAQAKTGQPQYVAGRPPQTKRELSPFSQDSHAGAQSGEVDTLEDQSKRPQGPKRLSTAGDATILEKVWGTLFNEQGRTTLRLGQFLRGIAVHIIEDYEPKHSLVITPSKMQQYYQDTKISNEFYPWQIIFDDHTSSISRLYREFEAQHHLVQDRLDERPDIPGLTPAGFEIWMTLLLLAHPEQEFERLAKTALHMPINNPDDKKERFPKEISRRLFPRDGDAKLAAKLQKAITTHCGISFASRHNSVSDSDVKPPQTSYKINEPTPFPYSSSQPQQSDAVNSSRTTDSARPLGSQYERERQPYSNTSSKAPSEASIDEDTSDVATPQPIERERKPYVAQPGAGKNHDVNGLPTNEKAEQTPGTTSDPKPRRTNSISSNNRPPPVDFKSRGSAPISIHQKPLQPFVTDVPEPGISRTRTNSVYQRGSDQQPRYNRNRSPSLSKTSSRRSEPEVNGDLPSSSHGSYSSSGPYTGSGGEHYRPQERYERGAPPSSYDGRDPRYTTGERESRPRYQSTSAGADSNYYNVTAADEYYRSNVPSVSTSYQSSNGGYTQHPPSSYREAR